VCSPGEKAKAQTTLRFVASGETVALAMFRLYLATIRP
jgi:hypothetical protein